MKYRFVSAFLILAIVQWGIFGQTIWKKDRVLKRGESYKFRTEPVDPSNPFKGKYISLNFSENTFKDSINRNLMSVDPVYVILEKDSQGFAHIKDLSVREPEATSSYVKAAVYFVSSENGMITVHLNYPFKEFYMDEYKAPEAEMIYRESARDTTKSTYALVKIRKGDAVIENVFINEIPIGDLIK